MLKFRIRNFQAIRDAEIHFAGFTALVGESNRGKSAVMRALRVVFQNGFHLSYITRGEKECVLTVEFDEPLNGVSLVEFTRSKTVNQYRVLFSSGVEQVFPKVGTGVPEPVLNLGFNPVESDRGDAIELNFQPQLSSLFLITESPVVLTTFLNQVFNVALYEQALRGVASDMGELTRRYNGNASLLLDKRRELGGARERLHILEERNLLGNRLYVGYKDLRAGVEKLVASRAGFQEVSTLGSLVSSLDLELKELEGVVGKLGKLLDVFSKVRSMRSLGVSIHIQQRSLFGLGVEVDRQQGLCVAFGALNQTVQKVLALRRGAISLGSLQREYEAYSGFESGFDFSLLNEAFLRVRVLLEAKMRLCKVSGEVLDLTNRVSRGESFVRELREDSEAYVRSIGVCPVCSSPMGSDVCGRVFST